MTEIDCWYVAFKNDHAYLKTTNNVQEAVQSSKTNISSNGPINHEAALEKYSFATKHQILADKNKTIPKTAPLNKSTNSNAVFLINSSDFQSPSNINMMPNKSVNPKVINDEKKSKLVPILPKITNAPLRTSSQYVMSKKTHKASQKIVTKKRIKKVTKPVNKNLIKDKKIRTIKLPPNLLKRIQSGEKLFMCIECKEVYTEHKDLLDHQKIHYKIDKNIVCKKKDKKETLFTKNKPSVIAVENDNVTNIVKNMSKTSESIFKSSCNPKKQKVVFEGECIMCHSVFQDLGEHVKTVHNSDLYKDKVNHLEFYCYKCNIEFDMLSQLLAHELSAHRETYSYSCEHCFKDFSLQEDLERHVEIYHANIMKYLCPYCDVGFCHSNELKTHLAVHIRLNGIESNTSSQNKCSPTRPEQLNQQFDDLTNILEDDDKDCVEEVSNDNDQVRFLKDDNKSADTLPSLLDTVINNDSTTFSFTFVSSSQKRMIINAYKSKIAEQPELKMEELQKILSKELGIGQRTISTTIYEYENFKTVSSPNRKKNRDTIFTKIGEFEKNGIRRAVHSFWFENRIPTLDKILSKINATEGLPDFSRTTLYSLLRQMGFKYAKRSRNSAMIECNNIIVWRRNYLENIKKFREEGRPIYYMDETWVNAGECTSRTWVDTTTVVSRTDAFHKGLTTGSTNPSGKGKRLIVVHIGNEDGFVPGGLLCFESKKNTKDYHEEMNGDVFFEWVESVLPRLKDNAVIVMDNARYHSVKLDKAPTSATKKADIIKWLKDKGEVIDKPMVMAQLMAIVKRLKPLHDKYVIDEYVKQFNKHILRLPPYHCKLNPIEMAWSSVKNYVKINNTTFKLPDVRRLLEEGVDHVNGDMWKNFIKHVIEEEKKFWDMDFTIDDMLAEPLIVTYTGDTTDDPD